ncbi:MAG: metallophosphoesterase [Planctomycetota bacterium]|jgi:hypothetical protein
MRRIFIGDIQGCLDALNRLLSAVDFDPSRDRLHPVGDLVNKGPDSVAVLARLHKLDAQPVLGNHDLRWLRRGKIEDQTLEGWLASQPIVRVMDDLIMVHAGLHPEWKESDLANLSDEQIDFAVTVRYCTSTGKRPEKDWPPPEAPYLPWDEHYEGSKQVVFGHWARRGLTRTSKVIGLDSGCVYGGKLSAWIAEEDRFVQVNGLARSS